MTTSLGEQFATALARKDASALKALLRADVDFRAMTPAKFWEATDVNVIVDDTILGKWFSPEREITEIVSIDNGTVGELDRVAYRFKATLPDGDFVVEQQAYYRAEGDAMVMLRIMCSGFVPAA
jgi:hypothetical protein